MLKRPLSRVAGDTVSVALGVVPLRLDVEIGLFVRAPMFHGLSAEQLAQLAKASGRRRFEAGEAIANGGAPADAAYLILAGQARQSGGGNGGGLMIGPGALICELAMFAETAFDGDVIAESQVAAAVFEREAVAAVLRRDRSMTTLFSTRIRERLLSLAYELHAIGDRLEDDGGYGPPDASPNANEASTGTWSDGLDQSRAASMTASDSQADARAGVVQTWSNLRPLFDVRQSRAR